MIAATIPPLFSIQRAAHRPAFVHGLVESSLRCRRSRCGRRSTGEGVRCAAQSVRRLLLLISLCLLLFTRDVLRFGVGFWRRWVRASAARRRRTRRRRRRRRRWRVPLRRSLTRAVFMQSWYVSLVCLCVIASSLPAQTCRPHLHTRNNPCFQTTAQTSPSNFTGSFLVP